MASATGSILVIDGSAEDVDGLAQPLTQAGWAVETARTGEEGLNLAAAGRFELVLAAVGGSEGGDAELIRRLRASQPASIIVALTEAADVRQAVESIKAGANEYLAKPIKPADVLSLIDGQVGFENDLPGRKYPFGLIVGQSQALQKVFDVVTKVADSDSTVLITGESGTGKELIARAIHYSARGPIGPLIPVNCGAIPEELLESELFGHEKGAFTNAIKTRAGRFELADGGTIFLDEIGEMSPKLQVKLLRVIQEKQFERVGGTRTITVNIRVIAATNQDLYRAVESGRFREDLYYRLNVIPVHIPPIRQRREDIPLLIEYFFNRFRRKKKTNVEGIDPEVVEALTAYDWPGNVRELENLIERLVILADGPSITLDDLPERITRPPKAAARGEFVLPDEGFSLSDYLAEVENDLIAQALEKAGGVKSKAAQILGINRTTLVEKMKKKGMM